MMNAVLRRLVSLMSGCTCRVTCVVILGGLRRLARAATAGESYISAHKHNFIQLAGGCFGAGVSLAPATTRRSRRCRKGKEADRRTLSACARFGRRGSCREGAAGGRGWRGLRGGGDVDRWRSARLFPSAPRRPCSRCRVAARGPATGHHRTSRAEAAHGRLPPAVHGGQPPPRCLPRNQPRCQPTLAQAAAAAAFS